VIGEPAEISVAFHESVSSSATLRREESRTRARGAGTEIGCGLSAERACPARRIAAVAYDVTAVVLWLALSPIRWRESCAAALARAEHQPGLLQLAFATIDFCPRKEAAMQPQRKIIKHRVGGSARAQDPDLQLG